MIRVPLSRGPLRLRHTVAVDSAAASSDLEAATFEEYQKYLILAGLAASPGKSRNAVGEGLFNFRKRGFWVFSAILRRLIVKNLLFNRNNVTWVWSTLGAEPTHSNSPEGFRSPFN